MMVLSMSRLIYYTFFSFVGSVTRMFLSSTSLLRIFVNLDWLSFSLYSSSMFMLISFMSTPVN